MQHDVLNQSVQELLALLKTITVIPVAVTIKRNELLQMIQDAGETIRTFLTRVKAKAVTCRFKKECMHRHAPPADNAQQPPAHVYVDYTSEMIRHVILNGLYDDEIKRDVFGQNNLDGMDVGDLVSLIEGKETARDATSSASTSAISQFKRRQQKDDVKQQKDDVNVDYNRKEKCRTCGNSFNIYRKLYGGRPNKAPFVDCLDCWKKNNHRGKHDNTKRRDDTHTKDASAVTFDISVIQEAQQGIEENSNMTVLVQGDDEQTEILPANDMQQAVVDNPSVAGETVEYTNPDSSNMTRVPLPTVLRHHVFTNGNWKLKLAQPHPTVDLTVSTNKSDYDQFGLRYTPLADHPIAAIVDSGAQCCLWGWTDCQAAGLTRKDLVPVKQKLNAVSMSRIKIHGAVILRMYGTSSSGGHVSCAVVVYVSPDVSGFYLSQEAMIQLKIVPSNFPSVGAALPHGIGRQRTNDGGVVDANNVPTECPCPQGAPPPGMPNELPMAATLENVGPMKEWLFERYSSSTFNTCPHQLLPSVEGPPLRLHVDPQAEPTTVCSRAKVPIHWEDQVKDDLKRDEALGVIEKVPYGEPSTWCHRMVVTRKDNGDPRRTVDLSPLNKHCIREVHAMKPPFELAKGIPPNTWRTVTDAWNGFHSIPLHKDDRHLTTFLSHWGPRYRYLMAPQGYASSGDGYNRRLDDILSDFERQKRCVDDNIHYDDDLEQHWWRTIELLELMGKNGVILNPDKFQFCQKVVDFAGFRLSETGIAPLPKYLDSISSFPTPTSITDIRSWFGLVNQVSHYAQLRDLVEPFRKFLSPKVKFYWNDDLDSIFKKSKSLILEAIENGVQIFDLERQTCLRCDWSKVGIGFYLCQKHCTCESEYPDCCEDGWKITLCGSRFLKDSETRYAAIEGEALAVAWALEQTKYFTMGCDNLVVVVDHRPLTKLLGDRTLDEIPNPRLFSLTQRTLPWIYKIFWLPGKGNSFSDATSRHPASDDKHAEINSFLCLVNSKMDQSMVQRVDEHGEIIATFNINLNKVVAVTWERVQEATFSEFGPLMTLIHQGFPAMKHDVDDRFTNYWAYRESLYIYDQVVMYNDRVVIPPSLRPEILESMHAAHQGETGMTMTAQSTVFWPGISHDIERTRKICRPCTRNAPSQPGLEPVPPIIPTTPFEAIVSDYFKYKGMNYLVVADRLSGWTECYRTEVGSNESGSSGLVLLLKKFFGTFGVPRELSSDGGSEFVARATGDFLTRWGVKHRLSAAYNPQSNGRAELAVKMTKRLIEDNIGPDGELDTDNLLRALLIKRNTPDPTCRLSPAEIVFGRKRRDTMPRIDKSINIFHNKEVRPTWTKAWEEKEIALRTRYQGSQESLAEHSKALPSLEVGHRVAIQNQTGSKPTKWDRTGTVLEVRDFDKYIVKVDGSGRLTLRNRRFLKKVYQDRGMFTPIPPLRKTKPSIDEAPEDKLTISEPTVLTSSPGTQSPLPHTPATHLGHLNDPALQAFPQLSEAQRMPPTHSADQIPTPTSMEATPGYNPTSSESSPRGRLSQDTAPATSRTKRNRKQRLFYDAQTGSYVGRNPGDELCD